MTISARLTLSFLAASLFVAMAKPASAPGSFTLEQVMSAPFASAPLAAPAGASVAWLLNEQGRRNVWVAGAPDWKGRKITSFDDDDGQEIAELSWMPDGKSMLFSRGGDFEMGRENPNPNLDPERPKQEIWTAYLDGEPAKEIAEGHSPVASPKGDIVAFIKDNQVYFVTHGAQQPAKAFEARGVSDLTWSPDGTILAFVSSRGDHGFVGLYRPAAKTLTYLNPSVDHDGFPSWSPDSKRVAYLRIPASSRPFAFGPEREGEPWSIWITDIGTGQSQRVFWADQGAGSVFRPVVASAQLFWQGENRLIFPWEKTGWLHLYSVGFEHAPAEELTPGEGELEHVARSKNADVLYYSSNIGDIDRRHLFKLDLAHPGVPEQVTRGEGIEFEPAPTADNSALVFLASSYNQKSHAEVRTSDGHTKSLAPQTVPADFPSAELVKPQPVLLTSADGMVVHGQLFLPPREHAGERHPALVFFHGGSRRQMLLGFHSMYYYSNAYAMNQYLANHGYVVLAVNYRSGIGYGLNFREALNYGATGASEFNDAIGAGLYLKSRSDVEPDRIGVWGGSYGGYLTALTLARASDLFAAGVDFHGVHDWNAVIENFVPAYDPKAQADAARIAFESSPMAWVKTWKSPVLLIHGDDDRNVPFSETVRLAVALRQQHVPFEELIFPNEIHDFLREKDWTTAYAATARFFQAKFPQHPN
jgi:dipeptidyl aminopeptidase/acylaminoacyl peptidase